MSLLGEADRPQHPRSGQLDGNKAPGRAPRRPKGLVETEVPTEGSVNLLPRAFKKTMLRYRQQQISPDQAVKQNKPGTRLLSRVVWRV